MGKVWQWPRSNVPKLAKTLSRRGMNTAATSSSSYSQDEEAGQDFLSHGDDSRGENTLTVPSEAPFAASNVIDRSEDSVVPKHSGAERVPLPNAAVEVLPPRTTAVQKQEFQTTAPEFEEAASLVKEHLHRRQQIEELVHNLQRVRNEEVSGWCSMIILLHEQIVKESLHFYFNLSEQLPSFFPV